MTHKLFVSLPLFLTLALSAAGCATSFTGAAHISGGAPACEAKCKGWGLELAGMVAMGEYSDACVCRRPGEKVSLLDASAGGGGGVAGVIMQTQAAEQARQASMHH